MLARAALRAKPRDDLDDQIDLIGQQRIEIDEAVTGQLWQLDVGGETRVLREPASVLVEELSQGLLRGSIFRQNTSAGDLGDVRRLQMDLQREAVHQAGKLDLLVVEAADELAKLLLRSDDDPVLAAAFHAEALNNGLQVEHLLYVASDELANFVDDEHQRLARPPALHQFIRALRELPR